MKKRWEDDYIGGGPGFWYVIIGDIRVGYFHYIKNARAYVRTVVPHG